jgi:hypothetical protein
MPRRALERTITTVGGDGPPTVPHALTCAFCCFAASQAVLNFNLGPTGTKAIAMQMTHDPVEIRSIFRSFSDEDKGRFMLMLYQDWFFHPIVYAVFFSLLASWCAEAMGWSDRTRSRLVLLVRLAAFADVCENTCQYLIFTRDARVPTIVLVASGVLAQIKWCAILPPAVVCSLVWLGVQVQWAWTSDGKRD